MRKIAMLLLACACVARSADDVEELKKRVAELEQEVIELKARSVPFKALAGDEVNITCWHVLDEHGSLSAQILGMLSLSADEAKRVDAALAAAHRGIADAVAGQKPQAQIADGKLTLAIGTFAESGKKIQDELRKTLLDALGHDRAAFFDKLALAQMSGGFLQFGQADYTFTIEKSGRSFSTRVEYKSGGGSGSTSGSSDRLDGEFESVKPYIPPEFGGTAGAAPIPEATPAAPAPAKPRAEF